MASEAVDEQARAQAESTNSMKSLPINENGDNTSLPSPPSSVKATGSDSGRNENDSHSAEFAGGEPSLGGSSASANRGANAVDAVNDEPSSGQSSNDPEQERTAPQDMDELSRTEHDAATRDTDEEAYVSDAESADDIFEEIEQATLYPRTSERRAPLQERIKKAPKRVVQQMAYTRLVEDRMKDMEKRLRLIENKGVEPEPPASPPGETNQPADLIMDIRRMTFEEYFPADPNPGRKELEIFADYEHKRRHEFPGQLPYHLIDVVVSSTDQPERLGKDQSTKPAAGSADLAAPCQDSTINDGLFLQPERIRINSTLLLDALQNITGAIFSKSRSGDERELQDQVILRPFKLFVDFEKEIRDEIDRLEKMHMRNGNECNAKAPEIAKNEDENAPSQPIADPLHKIPESSIQDHSVGLKDNESQHTTTDASVDAENEGELPLESVRCLKELRVLRELLDKDLKTTFDLRKQIKDGVARSIAFQDLWHLFPLGDEVVSNDSNGQNQIYRILNVSGGRPFLCDRYQADMEAWESTSNGRDLPKFEILSYMYDYDGKELGACQELHIIKSYDGKKAITSLPCFPIIYSKTSRGLKPRDFFIERGRRFIELTRKTDVVHKRYDGLTLAMDELREEVDSEVIIDVSMAMLKNNLVVIFGVTQELVPDQRETIEFLDRSCRSREGCCQNTPIHKDYLLDQKRNVSMLGNKGFMHDFIESDNELTEEDYLVCPCWVYGYVLRSRKWVKLEVSLVEDIKERGSGFDSLVLPDGHKETLLALVQTHSKGKKLDIGLKAENRQMDLVRGKGKGLIILLHGEPGVGKSSTAESVAEFTRRPLFQVTCGDIGESADEVEKRLENHFQLAHKWGCVLLLDEADVFLEARSKTDLKRNAIVSVFLRVLEYYSGILFLTTNRVGAFDQAFRSRIHMSLFYPKIEEDATIKIWEMNLDRAREIWGDNLSIDKPDREGILKFASKHYNELAKSDTTWNGRQIRNAFQTAIALAEWDAYQGQLKFKSPVPLKPRLEPEHFEKVAKASKHFDAYLKETQTGTMSDLASNNRERTDDFREV